MFLYIEANAIVSNPLLKGPQWNAVGDAVVTDVMDLFVSELTIDEAVSRYRASATAREKALDKTVRQWPAPTRQLLIDAIAASRTFAADYETLLRERLDMLGATVLPYPDVAHKYLASRALSRQAPFDSNGNGYRDTLHWLAFVELLESMEPDDAYAYLLSDDKGAFGLTAQRHLKAEVEELGVEWEVTFLSKITDFTVPGQFTDEEGSLEPSQEAQLEQSITDAITYGGTPEDFTPHLASRAGFDEARISQIHSLTISVDSVRVERRTRDLWVTFSCEAICDTDLETMEVRDEEAGDYSVVRDGATWVLGLEGTALSHRGEFSEIAALRLTSIDGDENYSSPQRPGH